MKYIRTGTLGTAFVAGVGLMAGIAVWDAFVRSSQVFTMLIVSIFVAAAYEPRVNSITARYKIKRSTATVFLFVATIVVLASALGVAGTLLYTQGQDLVESAPSIIRDIAKSTNRSLGTSIDPEPYIVSFESVSLGEMSLAFAGNSIRLLLVSLSVMLVSFYLTVDGPSIRKKLCSVLPANAQQEVLRIWDISVDKTGSYLFSRFILGASASVAHGIAFYSAGVPYALPLALWVGVISQLVPIVGTYIAAAVPIAVLLVGGQTGLAVGVLIFIVIYQQIENTIISPRVTRRTMSLNPLVAFLSVIFVTTMLGPVYALFALPLVATVQSFMAAYVQTHDLVDHHGENRPTQ